jgi:NADH-quinone oxidoreductase subunit G
MSNANYMYVDGMPVVIDGEKNLLQVIRKTGVKLPTFCYHTSLSTYGACRMCMVEDERGTLYTACSTPPKAGMNIKTNTARLRKYRKNILELLLANHCRDCTTCANNKSCKLQDLAARFNIEGVRFPNHAEDNKVTNGSDSIVFDSSKCILCGDCVRTCHEVQNVGAIDFAFRGSKMLISTAFGKPLSETMCVGCGQCAIACPTGAIMSRSSSKKVWDAISDPSVKTVVQVAPAVRVALGNMEGIEEGKDVSPLLFAALRKMGFDEVYDTSFGADITVIEESKEFLSRLASGEKLPIITSCCPAWIQYCEKRHPELLPNVSTCRSPMEMLASVIAQERQTEGKKLFQVAIMPCTAKKFEAKRPEFVGPDGQPLVDAVITTAELVSMLKEAGIQLKDLDPEPVDPAYGSPSGAGIIFGVTGGVTEAVLRNVVQDKSRASLLKLSNVGERGNEGIKIFELSTDDGVALRLGVASGLANAEKLLGRLKAGEKFDIIEIMACPGGCVAGGGQPFVHYDIRKTRGNGLYETDKLLTIRNSERNASVATLYERLLKGREHELLHVEYKAGGKN